MDYPLLSSPELVLSPPDIAHTRHHLPVAQQAYGLYSVDGVSAFTPQAQLQGGQVATTWNLAANPSSLSTMLSSDPPHNSEFAGNSQSTSAMPAGPASPMGPPDRPENPKTRKPKAATLRAIAWEPFKMRILDLHTVQNLPLSKVKQIMEEEYGFKAELRQYRTRISQWGKDKNIKPHEMQAIVRKRQRRKLVETNKAQLVFEVRGSQVEPQKIERWMKRHEVAEGFLYASSPAASTPSAVGCHTISERGSPAATPAFSPASFVMSPGNNVIAAQSLEMPSPALSVSSIVQPQASVFVGQIPALSYRSLAGLQLSFIPAWGTFESEMHVDALSRYRENEEERLRDQIRLEKLGILRELGGVLIVQGNYRTVDNVVRRLVESHDSQSGNGDQLEMLEALDLRGQILRHEGLYIRAERLFRRAIQGRKDVLGREHPDTLMSMYNLAVVLDHQGKYEDAEPKYRETLALTKRVLGPKHPHTLMSMYYLAAMLSHQGKYNEARSMHREALALTEEVLGPKHPDTLMSMYYLAVILGHQGKDEKAKLTHGKALALAKTVLWPKHPCTLISMYYLAARLVQSQGKYKEAESMHREALALTEKVLGPEHPDTLMSANCLAHVLANQHHYNTSLPF